MVRIPIAFISILTFKILLKCRSQISGKTFIIYTFDSMRFDSNAITMTNNKNNKTIRGDANKEKKRNRQTHRAATTTEKTESLEIKQYFKQ